MKRILSFKALVVAEVIGDGGGFPEPWFSFTLEF